ncbi:MAG TPA: hypothetical protein VF744_14030 [Beijerinckiaceae bacterium]|jgi:hypothetical protein
MSAPSDAPGDFAGLRRRLTAAGWRLDWVDEGPVRGEPILAAFTHPDGTRLHYVHDLLTGRSSLEGRGPEPPPEASAYAGLDVEARRQVLRWWIVQRRPVTPQIEAVLGQALQDPDPEIRVTALLAALRLKAVDLAGAVKAADIPDSTARGAFPGDRLLYRRLQAMTVEALAGSAPHRVERLEAFLDEGPPARPESLLLHALTSPIPEVSPPSDLPDGIVAEADGPRLRGIGIEMCWVPPVPHWRGGLRPADRGDPRVRTETPAAGCFIARTPLTPAQLAELGVVEADESGRMNAAAAGSVAERASRLAGAPVRIVDEAAWSLGLHGPDGRLFPWGNTLAPAQGCGPWGAAWSREPEWITKPEGLAACRVASPREAAIERAGVRLALSDQARRP